MNLAGRWQIRQSNTFVVDVTMKQQGDRLGAFCTTRRLRQLVLLIVAGAYSYFQQISTWIEVTLKEIESHRGTERQNDRGGLRSRTPSPHEHHILPLQNKERTAPAPAAQRPTGVAKPPTCLRNANSAWERAITPCNAQTPHAPISTSDKSPMLVETDHR